ncbi:1479_t:CDS:2, partial [Racocetra fulgida]
ESEEKFKEIGNAYEILTNKVENKEHSKPFTSSTRTSSWSFDFKSNYYCKLKESLAGNGQKNPGPEFCEIHGTITRRGLTNNKLNDLCKNSQNFAQAERNLTQLRNQVFFIIDSNQLGKKILKEIRDEFYSISGYQPFASPEEKLDDIINKSNNNLAEVQEKLSRLKEQAFKLVGEIVERQKAEQDINYLLQHDYYRLIITHPRVLEASGHQKNFNDWLVECNNCRKRYRLDHLLTAIEFSSFLSQREENDFLIAKECPDCHKKNFSAPRQFNLLLSTNLEITTGKENHVYLRPETCQGIFVNFRAIQKSIHRKLPFGIGQMGKSFRNEITLHHGIFRTREFEQMELEFFSLPEE